MVLEDTFALSEEVEELEQIAAEVLAQEFVLFVQDLTLSAVGLVAA